MKMKPTNPMKPVVKRAATRTTCAFAVLTTAGFCLYASRAANAVEAEVEFSGFGTFGFTTILDNKTATFQAGQRSGGTDTNGDFLVDTRLGIQADATLSDRWTATVQAILQDAQVGIFEPDAEWAFFKYQMSEVFSFRFGRLSLPAFSLSDYRLVGYAMPWVRAPSGFYSVIPMRNFDGIDVLADFSFADVYINANVFGGRTSQRFTESTSSQTDGGGINVDIEYGSWRLRFSQVVASTVVDDDAAGAQQAAAALPQLQEIADLVSYGSRDKPAKSSWTAFGIDLDFDWAFLNTEVARLATDGWAPDFNSLLIGGGFRVGTFTPYFTYSTVKQDAQPVIPQLPAIPRLQQLEAGVQSLLADESQDNIAAGVRWDFRPGFAFKAQYELISRKDLGISFQSIAPQTGPDDGKDVSVLTLSVDVIF